MLDYMHSYVCVVDYGFLISSFKFLHVFVKSEEFPTPHCPFDAQGDSIEFTTLLAI